MVNEACKNEEVTKLVESSSVTHKIAMVGESAMPTFMNKALHPVINIRTTNKTFFFYKIHD